MEMEVVLTDKLAKFMKKRGYNTLTVQMPKAKGCWGNPMTSSVMTQAPEEVSLYDLMNTEENVTVYVHKSLRNKKKCMKLSVSHFLWFYTIFETK